MRAQKIRKSAHPDLPDHLPVFPLTGVLLLPRGDLPLNIFEPRYIKMVDDALKAERLIGIIQPRRDAKAAKENGSLAPLYQTGCAGRITSFSETGDGGYLITLTGVSRFRMDKELAAMRGYRCIRPDWAPFIEDRKPIDDLGLDRKVLKALLSEYFQQNGLSCEWDIIDRAPDERLVNCLAMICPFDPGEKQALLEAPCCHQRAERFITMLKMAVHAKDESNGCH